MSEEGIFVQRRATDPSNSSVTVAIYVAAILVLAISTVAAIVGILALRPAGDNTAIIAAIVGFVTPVMLGILALITRENHLAMNSRLDQLLAASNREARAEGIVEGTATERATPLAPIATDDDVHVSREPP